MESDVRHKATLLHEDIVSLNFIRHPCPYFFRHHYREGLRSRLLQIINKSDLRIEIDGRFHDGIHLYPVAQPIAMLRIFKKQFPSYEDIKQEIAHYKLLQKWLPASLYAVSWEFMVNYLLDGHSETLLCGLQEYVAGEPIDPWRENPLQQMKSITQGQRHSNLDTALENMKTFIGAMQKMISRSDLIPDLAGVGNLVVTPHGDIKLVDINNISRLNTSHKILVDDKGYPVTDKSMQALYLLEKKVLSKPNLSGKQFYKKYLDPQRVKDVKDIEFAFHKKTAYKGNYPVAR